jgi:Asp-tRNA(Asn)/Glu-tRNA(Gln) amidotransferase A subunit family amidase
MSSKPSEIMAVILAGIEKLNPKLNAFCTITYDSAMAESQQADEKIVKKKARDHSSAFPCPLKIWFLPRVSA